MEEQLNAIEKVVYKSILTQNLFLLPGARSHIFFLCIDLFSYWTFAVSKTFAHLLHPFFQEILWQNAPSFVLQFLKAIFIKSNSLWTSIIWQPQHREQLGFKRYLIQLLDCLFRRSSNILWLVRKHTPIFLEPFEFVNCNLWGHKITKIFITL